MRSFSSLRVLAFAVLAAAATSAGIRAARADGDERPVYRSFDLRLTDAAMPEGWKLSPEAAGDADGKPIKEAILVIAKEQGLITAKFEKVDATTVQSAASADGKKAVFVFIDLDEKSDAFTTALKDAGAAKGWGVWPMGASTRLAVVAAPDEIRAKAAEIASANAVKTLATKAFESVENRMGGSVESRAKGALALDPKSALAHLAIGFVRYGDNSKDPAVFDDGIQHVRAALAKDATGEFAPKHKTLAQGLLGGLLLNKGGPSAEARDLLKDAVAGTAFVDRDHAMEHRYNLACAHARLKEADDAFKLLGPILEDNKKQVSGNLGSWWLEDPDFEGLRSDARWEELKKKYPPATRSSSDG